MTDAQPRPARAATGDTVEQPPQPLRNDTRQVGGRFLTEVTSRLGRSPGPVAVQRRSFVDRPHDAYTDVEWIARVVVRNLQWSRTQGVRRLVEEHELHPARRSAALVRQAQWRWVHSVAPGEARPVFLVGVPRSGTNMIARGLAASPAFEVHNEGDRAAFHRYRLRSDQVVRDIVERSRHQFVVFKPLLDIDRTRTLLELRTATGPRVLWVHRDVDRRMSSALVKFGPQATLAFRDIVAGRGERHWQARGLSPTSLELLHSMDWNQATAADGAAMVWLVKNELLFELGLDQRPDVLPFSYEDAVRRSDRMMQLVCRFLGATWQPRMSKGMESRNRGTSPRLAINPRIRDRCDAMAERLDVATTAAVARLEGGT